MEGYRVSSFKSFLACFRVCLVFVWIIRCCEHVGCVVLSFGWEMCLCRWEQGRELINSLKLACLA